MSYLTVGLYQEEDLKMNVFNILGTICDMIGGFLIARYLENDMKKEISAEIKKYETITN